MCRTRKPRMSASIAFSDQKKSVSVAIIADSGRCIPPRRDIADEVAPHHLPTVPAATCSRCRHDRGLVRRRQLNRVARPKSPDVGPRASQGNPPVFLLTWEPANTAKRS